MPPEPATHPGALTAWLFLRALGFVYAIAFASLLVQIDGLIGPQGILPAATYLDAVRQAYGTSAYWLVPTVFWASASTTALLVVCAAGTIAGLAVAADLMSTPALIVCWVGYLSVMGVGQTFLSFQWDSLLVETGVLAVVTRLWPEALAWLYRWLLFRLMYLSGIVKLLSGDATWRDLTALTYHFQTQPLPNPVSWYVHQLPVIVLKGFTLGTLLSELVVPCLYFGPRRLRRLAAAGTVAFQGLILLTGNYTFFNLLTMALALWLLDDATLQDWVPEWLRSRAARRAREAPSPWVRWSLACGLALLAALSLVRVLPTRVPDALVRLDGMLEPLRLTSSYGLFSIMTTTRPEIVFEGSDDGTTWIPYEFRDKPGDLHRPPPWVAPYHPRLDWQLWFAAMSDRDSERWVVAFARRLLEGSPPVVRLLEPTAWQAHPPKYVRATLYEYRFTRWSEAETSGDWWVRTATGSYLPALFLDRGELRRAY